MHFAIPEGSVRIRGYSRQLGYPEKSSFPFAQSPPVRSIWGTKHLKVQLFCHLKETFSLKNHSEDAGYYQGLSWVNL
jgi:hypothetical protein